MGGNQHKKPDSGGLGKQIKNKFKKDKKDRKVLSKTKAHAVHTDMQIGQGGTRQARDKNSFLRHNAISRTHMDLKSSVHDRSSMDEFLLQAKMSQKSFATERTLQLLVDQDDGTVAKMEVAAGGDSVAVVDEKKAEIYQYADLSVPRRPPWTRDMSKEELSRNENTGFLNWRRHLAQMAEASSSTITPYEKNLEVWRQLWRVMEQSDLVMQIVDARNPLLFRSADLELYVREIAEFQKSQKKSVLLVNKADLLSPTMRSYWAKYLDSQGIQFIFFSALTEQVKMGLASRSRREELLDDHLSWLAEKLGVTVAELLDVSQDTVEEPVVHLVGQEPAPEPEKEPEPEPEPFSGPSLFDDAEDSGIDNGLGFSATRVVNTIELIQCMRVLCADKPRATVGLVGFPNVGKSSAVNCILGAKKVGVSSTPGKTKHFQTLNYDDKLQLCDCPGLVFPTFMNSASDLVCNGVIPIHTLRNWISPIDLMCERIPRAQLSALYEVEFEIHKVVTARVLLAKYSQKRGFFTKGRVPDQSRAARIVLKDFTTGKLLYCHPPPNLSDEKRQEFYNSLERTNVKSVPAEQAAMERHDEIEPLDTHMLTYEAPQLDDLTMGASKKKHQKKVKQERAHVSKKAKRMKGRLKAKNSKTMAGATAVGCIPVGVKSDPRKHTVRS